MQKSLGLSVASLLTRKIISNSQSLPVVTSSVGTKSVRAARSVLGLTATLLGQTTSQSNRWMDR